MTDRIARRLMGLASGLALSAATLPAIAADMGGIRDYGGAGGVPVPAPVPVAEYDAEWYIGIAAGGVLSDDAAVTNVGSSMPVRDSLDKVLFGGISAGRYISKSLRMEIAVDAYDDVKLAGPAESHYTGTKTAEGPTVTVTTGTTSNSVTSYNTNHYDVTRVDNVSVNRTTAMLNMFYDLDTGTRFRPYIGAGIGVTWRGMKRGWTEDAECTHTTNNLISTMPADACAVNTDELPATYSTSGSVTTDRFDLALAAMAGISYEISPGIIWDNGYQLLWEGAGIEISTDTAEGISTVSYTDALQHHFRTGLRFNIE